MPMPTSEPIHPLPPARFRLDRLAILPEGAFGVLSHAGLPFAVTLERTYPFAGGRQMVKIPPGRHACTPTTFHGGKPTPYATFEILVPGHARLLFHRGNVEDDSEGCVLVAESYGVLQERAAILASAEGFKEFMRLTDSQPFDLEVREWSHA